MDDSKNVGGRDRLVRTLLTIGLSIVAVRWLRRGKRVRGLLAGIGALGLGFSVTTKYCGVNDTLDIDTTSSVGDSLETSTDEVEPTVSEPTTDGETTAAAESDAYQLRCAFCGEPIVPGQSRGPNSQGDIVHDNCA